MDVDPSARLARESSSADWRSTKLSCWFDCRPAILQAELPGSDKTSGTKRSTATALVAAISNGHIIDAATVNPDVLPLDDSTLISTRDLSTLPGIENLRLRMQQMAALESVFAIEYGEPVYAFHPTWRRSQQMGAVKNGSGDELFAHFTPAGGCIIGFAHESAMSPYRVNPPKLWPGLLSSVPADFKSSLDEPAFDIQSTTFVVWRRALDDAWHTDNLEYSTDSYGDGSNDLLSRLMMSPIEFTEWLEENYEVDVATDIVTHVFLNKPLTLAQLSDLNPDAPPASLKKAVTETGYPLE